MSGLLERIVRRRRASASSRLGPPEENGHLGANGTVHANGGPPAGAQPSATGHEPPTAVPTAVWTPPVAPAQPEPAPAQPEPAPAQPEPAPAPQPDQPLPTFIQRGHMRRRARYLRQLREIQLRDLGGFLLELNRFGRERPELVQAKIAGAASTDSELRALDRALGAEQPVRELRVTGVGGACPHCGAVHGSADRYCASCGEPLTAPPPDS